MNEFGLKKEILNQKCFSFFNWTHCPVEISISPLYCGFNCAFTGRHEKDQVILYLVSHLKM